MPLRVKSDFSDLRGPPLTLLSAPPYFSETRSPLLSAPPEFWPSPLRFRSHPAIKSVANSGLLSLRVALFCSVAYYGNCTCIALYYSVLSLIRYQAYVNVSTCRPTCSMQPYDTRMSVICKIHHHTLYKGKL